MFTLANNNVVAPIATTIFNSPATAADITTYLADYRATDNTTIATIGAMLLALATAAVATPADALAIVCAAMFRTGAAAAIIALCAAPTGAATTDNEINIVAIQTNLPNSRAWIVNLVNAAKKSPVTEGNVEGFFAMLGHTGTKASSVARFINMVAPFFADNISQQAFRDVLASSAWTTYRINRFSAGSILTRLTPDFIALGILVAGDANTVHIAAANAAPWDHNLANAIPVRIKAYASIYLEAAGTPIDGWFQGNKAVAEMPSARVRTAKSIMKKYLEVKNNIPGLDAFADVAAFNAPAVRAFW
jgi:hypothetical protein